MPFFILSLIIQVGLIVHVVKTGRQTFWIFVLLFAPMVGPIAYFFVEILPELLQSRTARTAGRSIAKAVDPGKDIRAAEQRFAVAQTAQNAMLLAEELLEKGRYNEASELYRRFLAGMHADDARMLMGLARAEFGMGAWSTTIETLDRLKAAHPSQRSPDGHLLYARALQESGREDEAMHEYQALCGYFAGPEPFCRLGLMLKARGQGDQARPLFEKVVSEAKISGRHYNTLHKEWVAIAKREVGG